MLDSLQIDVLWKILLPNCQDNHFLDMLKGCLELRFLHLGRKHTFACRHPHPGIVPFLQTTLCCPHSMCTHSFHTLYKKPRGLSKSTMLSLSIVISCCLYRWWLSIFLPWAQTQLIIPLWIRMSLCFTHTSPTSSKFPDFFSLHTYIKIYFLCLGGLHYIYYTAIGRCNDSKHLFFSYTPNLRFLWL